MKYKNSKDFYSDLRYKMGEDVEKMVLNSFQNKYNEASDLHDKINSLENENDLLKEKLAHNDFLMERLHKLDKQLATDHERLFIRITKEKKEIHKGNDFSCENCGTKTIFLQSGCTGGELICGPCYSKDYRAMIGGESSFYNDYYRDDE